MLKEQEHPADYPPLPPRLVLALATWGGAGYLPAAPGTWGTLAALPLWWLLTQLGPGGYALAFAVLLLVSVGVAGPAQRLLGRVDHPAIVIDEVVGLLVALAGIPADWRAAALGVFLFRTFDILKPWPIRWLSRGNGGQEVVLDDITAGIMARMGLALVGAMTGIGI